MAASDVTSDGYPTAQPARGRRPLMEWAIVVPTIVFAVVLMYLQPVFDLGFYYDDLALLAALDDAPGGGWDDRFAACREIDSAGRTGVCAYHATVNVIFGEHASAYHLLSMALLTICTLLLYALLRRCNLGQWRANSVWVRRARP